MAINEIKKHPYKHSLYLIVKGFSDYTLLWPFVNTLTQWLYDLFLYLRSIHKEPVTTLSASYIEIRDTVSRFIERIKTFSVADELSDIPTTLVSQKLYGMIKGTSQVSIEGMKTLYNVIFGSCSCVLQWLWTIKGRISFELHKYCIQIAGCIMYYLDCLEGAEKYLVTDIKKYYNMLIA